MLKLNQILNLTCLILIVYSCNGQKNSNNECKERFKKARDLAYQDTNNITSLNSALLITNDLLNCDSIRNAVVDFKIMLLTSLKKYKEGVGFVSSLNEKDFSFKYKKGLMLKNFQALDYADRNDSLQKIIMYSSIVNDLEQYIKKNNLNKQEFEEVFLDLYAVKGYFISGDQIKNEIDSLKKKYPDKSSFFDFFY